MKYRYFQIFLKIHYAIENCHQERCTQRAALSYITAKHETHTPPTLLPHSSYTPPTLLPHLLHTPPTLLPHLSHTPPTPLTHSSHTLSCHSRGAILPLALHTAVVWSNKREALPLVTRHPLQYSVVVRPTQQLCEVNNAFTYHYFKMFHFNFLDE